MRILFVNTSEHTGGAAIAAKRLMKALNSNHMKVKIMVRDKSTNDADVITNGSGCIGKLKFVVERARIWVYNHFKTKRLFAIDPAFHGTDITHHPEFKRADIIHLHWVNQGMLSLTDIKKILRSGKPVVWTMHDMWPFTGICHQAGKCDRWRYGCGNCPLLPNSIRKEDLSEKVWKKKEKLFSQSKSTIHFVGCSNWLADLAKESPFLAHHHIESIANPIDTRFFHPDDKKEARRVLGLPEYKKILLFVAYKATDKNKGIDYLRRAVELVCEQHPEMKEQLCVVPVGREAELLSNTFKCEVCPQNYVTDENVMRHLYNAADLLMMPTLMDNLPNTIVEAMACGVPCVGFHVGGLPQMIAHRKNGYLAEFRSAADFAKGIWEMLTAPNYAEMAVAARRSAVCNYSEDAVAERYIDLYEEALDQVQ